MKIKWFPRMISAWAVASIFILALVSCGGGGGGGGASQQGSSSVVTMLKASGRVVIPTGSSIQDSGLTVSTAADSEPVKADGTFTVLSGGTGPTIAFASNAAGKVVLLGYVDGNASGSSVAGGHGELSAKKTADVLLFEALAAWALPKTYWAQSFQAIDQSSQATSLATVVSARIASDPTDLSDGDPQIDAAVQTAVASVSSSKSTRAFQPSVASSAAGRDVQTASLNGSGCLVPVAGTTIAVQNGRAATPYHLVIQNPGEQAGVEVLLNNLGTGINFVNHYRRRATAFIYEVATADSQGNVTTLTQPIPLKIGQNSLLGALINANAPLNNPSVNSEYSLEISAANALNGVIGSISDVATFQGAWTPTTTAGVNLPPDPSAPTTYYKVFVVGPSPDPISSSALAQDPTLAAFVPLWQLGQQELGMEEFILDVLLPILSNLSFDSLLGVSEDTSAELVDLANFLGGLPDVNKNIASGDFTDAMKSLLQLAADTGTFRQTIANSLLNNIQYKYPPNVFGSPQTVGEHFQSVLEEAGAAVEIVDNILAGMDIAKVELDYQASAPVVEWDVRVDGDTVTLTPQGPTVSNVNSTVALTATVVDYPDPSQFRFEWTVTGALGALYDVNSGQPIPAGQTTTDKVNFVAATSAKEGMNSRVTVAVYDTSNNDSLYGTASTEVTYSTCSLGSPTISGSSPTWSVTWSQQIVHVGDTITATVTLGSDYGNNTFDLIPYVPGKWVSVDGGTPYVDGPDTDPPDLLNDNRLSLWHAPFNYNLAGTHTIVFQVTGVAVTPCTHMDANVDEGNVQGLHIIPVYFESVQ